MSMKMKIELPTSMAEIPLRSYQQYLTAVKNSNDEEFLAHKFVQIFLGLQLAETLKVSAKDMKKLIGHLTKVLRESTPFIQQFHMGGIDYGFIPDLENMSWGEYIDLENNLQSWESYHVAMAVMYRPITKRLKDTYEIAEYDAKDEYAEAMKFAPLNVVLGSAVFFCHLELDCLNATLDFLSNQREMNNKTMTFPKGVNSQENGDGIIAYIDYLKGMLDGLTQSPLCISIEHLPSWSMK